MDGQLEILGRDYVSQPHICVLAPRRSRLHSPLLSSNTVGQAVKLRHDWFLERVHSQQESNDRGTSIPSCDESVRDGHHAGKHDDWFAVRPKLALPILCLYWLGNTLFALEIRPGPDLGLRKLGDARGCLADVPQHEP